MAGRRQELKQELQIEPGYTTCKTCNRVIKSEHADEDGNCSEHPNGQVEEVVAEVEAEIDKTDEAQKTGYTAT